MVGEGLLPWIRGAGVGHDAAGAVGAKSAATASGRRVFQASVRVLEETCGHRHRRIDLVQSRGWGRRPRRPRGPADDGAPAARAAQRRFHSPRKPGGRRSRKAAQALAEVVRPERPRPPPVGGLVDQRRAGRPPPARARSRGCRRPRAAPPAPPPPPRARAASQRASSGTTSSTRPIAERLVGVDRRAGQEQAAGPRRAHRRHEPAQAVGGVDHPEPRGGHPEAGAAAGDAPVAGDGELERPAEGRPVQHADHRDRAGGDRRGPPGPGGARPSCRNAAARRPCGRPGRARPRSGARRRPPAARRGPRPRGGPPVGSRGRRGSPRRGRSPATRWRSGPPARRPPRSTRRRPPGEGVGSGISARDGGGGGRLVLRSPARARRPRGGPGRARRSPRRARGGRAARRARGRREPGGTCR